MKNMQTKKSPAAPCRSLLFFQFSPPPGDNTAKKIVFLVNAEFRSLSPFSKNYKGHTNENHPLGWFSFVWPRTWKFATKLKFKSTPKTGKRKAENGNGKTEKNGKTEASKGGFRFPVFPFSRFPFSAFRFPVFGVNLNFKSVANFG